MCCLSPENEKLILTSTPARKRCFIPGVRRQGFWNQERLKLSESLAHLVSVIMRRVCCDASVAFRASCV